MEIHCTSPVFQVADLHRAITFYVETLGFQKEFVYGEPPFYGGVKRNDLILHLNSAKGNQQRQGKGSIYIFCDEVDEFYQQMQDSEVEFTTELATWPYGMRDFQIADPDGNLLTFGTAVEEQG